MPRATLPLEFIGKFFSLLPMQDGSLVSIMKRWSHDAFKRRAILIHVSSHHKGGLL